MEQIERVRSIIPSNTSIYMTEGRDALRERAITAILTGTLKAELAN